MSAPNTILVYLPSLCEQLSTSVHVNDGIDEILTEFSQNNIAEYFWHTVHIGRAQQV